MINTVIACSDEQRGPKIKEALAAADVETERIFASTHGFLQRLARSDLPELDLLIIDESIRPVSQWDLVREVSVRYPTVPILAIVSSPSPEHFALALANGARGVLRYPLSYDEIISVVESVASWSSAIRSAVTTNESTTRRSNARVFALAGAKGGVGSSTLALHLALVAKQAEPSQEVILVDFDQQKPDQSILFDVPQTRSIVDLLPVINELAPRHLDEVLFHHESGIRILLGPKQGEEMERIDEFAARQIVGMLASRADIVIIDMGSVMGEANTTALEMSSDVCIVTTPDVLSLRGVHRLKELWERIGVKTEGNTQIIVNKFTKRNDLNMDSVRKIVNSAVLDSSVPFAPDLEIAVNRRDPMRASPQFRKSIQNVAEWLEIIHTQSLKPNANAPAVPPHETETSENMANSMNNEKPQQKKIFKRGLRSKAERGAISIEMLAVVPLVGIALMIAFQLILVGVSWTFAGIAANEGSRALAVGNDPTSAARSVTPASFAKDMQVSSNGSQVTVRITAPTVIPASERFRFSVPVSAGVVKEPA